MSQQNGLPINPPISPKTPPIRVREGLGKPFTTALALHRQNATLHEKTADVEETRPKCHVPQEEGHNARNV